MSSTLIIRDPFREMRSLMRHAFDDNLLGWFDDLPRGTGPGGSGTASNRRPIRSLTIPLDVFESESGLTVSAPLPGFARGTLR